MILSIVSHAVSSLSDVSSPFFKGGLRGICRGEIPPHLPFPKGGVFRPEILLALTFGALVECPPLLEARILDRTLATVNSEAILLSEFEKNATPILEQFRKASPVDAQTPERISDIKKRVLDQMVDDRILTQEAKKRGIRVSKIEVDEGVKKVRGRFSTEEEFNKELQKEAITYEDFRKHIQDQLSTIKLIDQEVKAKTPPPTEAEIKDLYETLVALLHDKPLPPGHKVSELDELKSVARAMEHRFGERVGARHILIRVDPKASTSEREVALKKIKDIQRRLKNGEDFSELAKKYSEDPGSKERGGNLPPFSHGDMVEPFEKAAFVLQVGQTSDMVSTDFGYHIIRVEEKKASSKFSFDDVKEDLREYLFQQRAAKRFESYIKTLRAKADIKINNLE